MQPGSTPPPGFTKIGTTTVSYKNLAGKNQNASLDIYQKN
jgi:hypothetical protein